jgi:hypothetical protein
VGGSPFRLSFGICMGVTLGCAVGGLILVVLFSLCMAAVTHSTGG